MKQLLPTAWNVVGILSAQNPVDPYDGFDATTPSADAKSAFMPLIIGCTIWDDSGTDKILYHLRLRAYNGRNGTNNGPITEFHLLTKDFVTNTTINTIDEWIISILPLKGISNTVMWFDHGGTETWKLGLLKRDSVGDFIVETFGFQSLTKRPLAMVFIDDSIYRSSEFRSAGNFDDAEIDGIIQLFRNSCKKEFKIDDGRFVWSCDTIKMQDKWLYYFCIECMKNGKAQKYISSRRKPKDRKHFDNVMNEAIENFNDGYLGQVNGIIPMKMRWWEKALLWIRIKSVKVRQALKSFRQQEKIDD